MKDGLRVKIIRDQRPEDAVTKPQHRYGRSPSLVLPNCHVCNRTLDLIFDFDMSDHRLDFLGVTGLERLFVVNCLGCDLSYSGQLFYRITGDAIKILKNDAKTKFEPYWHTALPFCKVELSSIPPEELPSSYADEFAWLNTVQFSEPPKHQLGGYPIWIQDQLDFFCIECGKRMRFIGQVASETWPSQEPNLLAGHMFGDMGMIYIHFCDSCGIFATGGSCY